MELQGIIIKVVFSGSCFSTFVRVMKNISKDVFSTAVLTIDKVSAKDFQATFTCNGRGSYETTSKNITLRRGEWREPSLPFTTGTAFLMLFPPARNVFWPCHSVRGRVAVLSAPGCAAQVLHHWHHSFIPSLSVTDKTQKRWARTFHQSRTLENKSKQSGG